MKEDKNVSYKETIMRRCLELASKGLGYVAPNPMVGAVLLYDGKIIGEGYHREFGKAHAEVNAINSVSEKSLLKKSTLFVNLEPCVHTCKKTPPCTDFIIEMGIPAVCIGISDPNHMVAGKGIEKLKENGVHVEVGILENECRNLNQRFFTFHELKRPYIILKWAQTKDGFIDINRKQGEPVGVNWISNAVSRDLVHKWRSEEQSVMVGTNTVLTDDPKLNVRHWKGKDPVRIILDQHLRIPPDRKIWDNSQETWIMNTKKNQIDNKTKYIKVNELRSSLKDLMLELYKRNILSVIIEGGKELLENLIDQNLWDEARVFIGDKIFLNGVKAPGIGFPPNERHSIADDSLLIFRNTREKKL